jgi:hypothetical protein
MSKTVDKKAPRVAAKSEKSKSSRKPDEIELHPNGWKRFEKAVDSAAKAGPMHGGKA